MKYDIKKQQFLCEIYLESKSIVTVQCAWKLTSKKNPNQHVNKFSQLFKQSKKRDHLPDQ
jgi:hypothetical protein